MLRTQCLAILALATLFTACSSQGPSSPSEVPINQVDAVSGDSGQIHSSSACSVSYGTAYSQNNGSWASTLLGNSSTDTIGGQGCVVTVLAMVYHNKWGVSTTPPQLNTSAKSAGCFPAGSSLINVNCGINSRGGPHGVWDVNMSDVASLMCNGVPVMVDVTWGGGHKMLVNYYNGGSTTSMSSYSVIDPWDGTSKSLSSYTATRWRKMQ
jgi:hypothetical protein